MSKNSYDSLRIFHGFLGIPKKSWLPGFSSGSRALHGEGGPTARGSAAGLASVVLWAGKPVGPAQASPASQGLRSAAAGASRDRPALACFGLCFHIIGIAFRRRGLRPAGHASSAKSRAGFAFLICSRQHMLLALAN